MADSAVLAHSNLPDGARRRHYHAWPHIPEVGEKRVGGLGLLHLHPGVEVHSPTAGVVNERGLG